MYGERDKSRWEVQKDKERERERETFREKLPIDESTERVRSQPQRTRSQTEYAVRANEKTSAANP